MKKLAQAQTLQRVSHELLYLGTDGASIFTDRFLQLNETVQLQCEALFPLQGETPEEEAHICLALLMGYGANIYSDNDKENERQTILHRSCNVLNYLPATLLKCQLLAFCYGEVYEKELSAEAHEIISSWNQKELSAAELEVVEHLRNLEKNQYSWKEI